MPALTSLSGLLAVVQEGDSPPAGGFGGDPFILLLGMFAIIFFVAILPERKARKRKQAMIAALKKNDQILTTAGMFATVAAVGENDVTIKFDDGTTRVKLQKSAIAAVLTGDGEPSEGRKA